MEVFGDEIVSDLMVFPVLASMIFTLYFETPGRESQVQVDWSGTQTAGVGDGTGQVDLSLFVASPAPQTFSALTLHW